MEFKTLTTVLKISLIFVLTMGLFIQDKRLQYYKHRFIEGQEAIALQNAAIDQMKLESQKQTQRIQDAQKEAQKVKVEYDIRIKQIMSVQVPTSCEEAMKWGIQQAKLIK